MSRPTTNRLGFTLIELVVVMAILAVLGGLTIMILPYVTAGQYTSRATSRIQQTLEGIKQQAARDRAIKGVRLIPDPNNPQRIIRIEFLEQPESYHLGSVANPADATRTTTLPSTATLTGNTVRFTNTSRSLTGGFTDPTLYPVQPGDYIELGGLIFRIAPNGVSATQLTLNTPPPPITLPPITTSNYRIIRQPRPLGDDPLEFAENIVIDIAPRGIGGGQWDLPAPTVLAPLDIMFAPDGRVMGNLAARDKIILWVRDVSLPDGQGDPMLVVVYPLTGLIAAHAVDVTNLTTNPYSWTATGKRSSD